ncbi:2-polyprenylphenol 6-hydroxylase [Clostridium prolinivorans]|uniref:2-polyprenylphenol 6-hydroxylase n=1 Tax=Clostridium prolinivorans TaxID=2769420 RepID=UPI002B05DE44|nr:2-polyprenylphenol 6-hydroxylase [Clostridium prolinivorans]
MIAASQYNHIKRVRQIIQVFIKHGFGAIIDNIGILSYLKIKKKTLNNNVEDKVMKLTVGQRLRLALEELGPTFVKLGQIISTRHDLLPKDIIEELEKLQDSVPPFPFEEVKNVIESELGDKLENIYAKFDKESLAAASIAQVHLAQLLSGKRVVVKVQRPNIEEKIDLDIKILKDIAYFIDNHTKYGKLYDFNKMVKEFEISIKNELDFRIEGENAETFKNNFSKDKNVSVPNISWIHTTQRVLTMEYIEGIKLNDFDKFDKAGIDRKEIAYNLATSIFNQILRDGFFHGDPHPGNIMVLEGNKIVFLDLGMVGKLNQQRKNQFLKMLMGITLKNSKLIIEGIIGLDAIPNRINMKKLEKDIDVLRDKYLSIPLSEIKIGEMFNEIFNLAFFYNIVIPSEFTMLAKSLITLEGIVEKLNPDMSVLEVAEPIAEKLIFTLFSPEKIGKEIITSIMDYGNLARKFPSSMINFLDMIEDEDFTMQFKIKGIEDITKRIDKIFNRLSFSVVLLAVSIIIAGIIIGSSMNANIGAEMYLFNITILRVGLVIAALIILFLIISILRSSRL